MSKIVSEATSEIELERSLQELHTCFADWLVFKVIINPLATRIMGIKGPALVTVISLLMIFFLMVQLMDRKI